MNKMIQGFCHAKKTKFGEDKVLFEYCKQRWYAPFALTVIDFLAVLKRI